MTVSDVEYFTRKILEDIKNGADIEYVTAYLEGLLETYEEISNEKEL